MKRILGLDVGTNSIGAAVITLPDTLEDFGSNGSIEWMGSRIVPVDTESLNKWEAGVSIESKAAARRLSRGTRRLKQRYKLRRDRLLTVLKILGWVRSDFPTNFKKESVEDKAFKISEYLPIDSETIDEARALLGGSISEDWVVYYIRKKGLSERLSYSELARIFYMMNQRRGFKSSRKDLKDESVSEIKLVKTLTIQSVEEKTDKLGFFEVTAYPIDGLPNGCVLMPWEEKKSTKPDWVNKEFTFLLTWPVKEGVVGKQLKPQLPGADDCALSVTALDQKMGNKHPGEYFFDNLVDSQRVGVDFKIRQYAVYRKKYKEELTAIWKKQCQLNPELQELETNKNILKSIADALYNTQSKLQGAKEKEFLSRGLFHILCDDIIYYQRELKSQRKSIAECQYEKHKDKDGNIFGLKVAPRSNPYFQEFRIWQNIHNIKVFQNEVEREVTDTNTGEIRTRVFRDQDVTKQYINADVKERLFEKFDSKKLISITDVLNVINSGKPKQEHINKDDFRINMFFQEDKKLQGNETKAYFRSIFEKNDFAVEGEQLLQSKEHLFKLWSISYSISLTDEEKSQKAIIKALTNDQNRRGKAKTIQFNLPKHVALAISKAPEIDSSNSYAAYSTKAIKKLLPLMRVGKFWTVDAIDKDTYNKVNDIIATLSEGKHTLKSIANLASDEVTKAVYKSFVGITTPSGLNTYQACYVVYDRHSEKEDFRKYDSVDDFEKDILKKLPNNSLNNPIVEQITRETLFLVRDIWKQFGKIDEIHIELARELKKNAKEREKMTKSVSENEQSRIKIKNMLYELLNSGFEQLTDDGEIVYSFFETKPNPENPLDIKKFSIWQSHSAYSFRALEDRAKKERIPKESEYKKFALWLSQECRSPYTGRVIPLSALFTAKYEVEHILPRAKIKNDSMNNLIIAERDVNKAKGNELAALFIEKSKGFCEHNNQRIELLTYSEYITHCKQHFRTQRGKLRNLLALEIPEDFISRQLNDTRYITKKISQLLYPVARGRSDAKTVDEQGGIVFAGGSVTSELKKSWGLSKVWKKLMLPRFERLQAQEGVLLVTQNERDRNDVDITIRPLLEKEKDGDKKPDIDLKRLDHRHHALDALIIACTTIEHIRYYNTLNASEDSQIREKIRIKDSLFVENSKDLRFPWPTFVHDVKKALEETVVTFRQNNKVYSKPVNKIERFAGDGTLKKVLVNQKPHSRWLAVRKPLFSENPLGKVLVKQLEEVTIKKDADFVKLFELQYYRSLAQDTPAQKVTPYIYDQKLRADVKKILSETFPTFNPEDIANYKIIKKALVEYLSANLLLDSNGEPVTSYRVATLKPFSAKRVPLNDSFDAKKIGKIPYADDREVIGDKKQTIPQLLLEHLKLYGENPKLAFSNEGLEALDKKAGRRIRKVTIKEDVGIKIPMRHTLVESGSNAYFVFYEDPGTKERTGFSTLSSFEVVRRKLNGEPLFEHIEGKTLHIYQVGDIVYVPTPVEQEKLKSGLQPSEVIDLSNKNLLLKRLYKVVKFTTSRIYFAPLVLAKLIVDKEINSSGGANIESLRLDVDIQSSISIRTICIKINTDRLGNLSFPK